MKITEVKTAFKIMDVKPPKNYSLKLNFNYLNKIIDEKGNLVPPNLLTKNVSRVYIIVVNDKIYKIGSSADKGGMKGTLRIYTDGGVKGRPSIRSYGVYKLMYNEILKGSKIEFWMIYQDEIKGLVKGLFSENENVPIIISPKIIEERCLLDYKSVSNGKYPIWNLQEQGKDWPDVIKIFHSEILEKSTKRPKKIGRK